MLFLQRYIKYNNKKNTPKSPFTIGCLHVVHSNASDGVLQTALRNKILYNWSIDSSPSYEPKLLPFLTSPYNRTEEKPPKPHPSLSNLNRTIARFCTREAINFSSDFLQSLTAPAVHHLSGLTPLDKKQQQQQQNTPPHRGVFVMDMPG